MSQRTKTRKALQQELQRLQLRYGFGGSLKVRYLPSDDTEKRGAVREDTVLIYDQSLKEALKTLRHEFLDFALTQEIVQPLVDVLNLLLSLVVKEAYRRKEELVERFSMEI